jgi:hypothetical protein
MNTSRSHLTGILCGAGAGVIDLIPMVIQHLPLNALLGAFSMWVVAGFFISAVPSEMPPFLKGILVSLAMLLPSSFIIEGPEPFSLFPVIGLTIVLGAFLGYAIGKLQSGSKK